MGVKPSKQVGHTATELKASVHIVTVHARHQFQHLGSHPPELNVSDTVTFEKTETFPGDWLGRFQSASAEPPDTALACLRRPL